MEGALAAMGSYPVFRLIFLSLILMHGKDIYIISGNLLKDEELNSIISP